ncbi:MAG: GNAT family N-acetyltransferase [Amaricoccus sp.]|uniref:GNAT family N-acetyltransferase n=1 Tax=Amaricoccus sp. TaxID=1872485 RepID=UPI0039E61FA4
MTLVRDVTAADEPAWRRLWDGYLAFYETALAPEITSRTWARLIDPASPLFGRLAEVEGEAAGFSVSVLHEGSWVASPVCYLEDLFVDPRHRGRGLGRALVQDLVDLGRARGWSTLYWHTRTGNPARRLYDAFTPADDFVRYRLRL